MTDDQADVAAALAAALVTVDRHREQAREMLANPDLDPRLRQVVEAALREDGPRGPAVWGMM